MFPSPGQRTKDPVIVPITHAIRKSCSINGRSEPNIIESRQLPGQSGWYIRFTCQSPNTPPRSDNGKCSTESSTISQGRIVPTLQNLPRTASTGSLLKTIRKWYTSKLERFIAKDPGQLFNWKKLISFPPKN